MTGTRVRETTVLGTVSPDSSPTSGRFGIVIIEGDRWGSSGYYPGDVIERDGPRVFASGTQVFLDHPTETEHWDRPERSVRDLAGVISSTPTWNGEKRQLEAEMTVLSPYVSLIHEIAPYVGISINAYATQESGEVGGRYGPVTTAFEEAISVDVVTKAGAGGAIVKAIESARSVFLAGQPSGEHQKESEIVTDTKVGQISDDTLSALTAAITALNTTLTAEAEERATEAARKAEAEKPDPLALVGALAEAKLPRAYQARVIEAVRQGMSAEDAVAAAKTELAEVLKDAKATVVEANRVGYIGAPQGDGNGAVGLPNGLTVDISEARVNRALGKKVAG